MDKHIAGGQSANQKPARRKNGKLEKMSISADLLQKLLLAHVKNDDEKFHAVAWQAIEKERQIHNYVLANELERILLLEQSSHQRQTMPLPNLNNLPKDRERVAQLIELIEPKRQIEQLVLTVEVQEALDRIILERRKSDLLGSHGVRPISKILFCGPPGCGKSVAAEALASALYLPLAIVRFDAVVSSYLGETAANLRRVFEFARTRPMVLFFDEFDAIGKHRTAKDEHGELKRVVNSFLQLLDGFHSDTLTIAATNHQMLLDSALWRRFDEIVLFPLPNKEEIEDLLALQFKQIHLEKSIQLSNLAKKLIGFSHADIEHVALDSIKKTLLESKKEVSNQMLLDSIKRQFNRTEISHLINEQPHTNVVSSNKKIVKRKNKKNRS